MRLKKQNVIVHNIPSNDMFSHDNGIVEVRDKLTPGIISRDGNNI